LKHFPSDLQSLETVEPVYRSFPGWKTATSDIRRYRDLPPKARKYLGAIASLSSTDLWMISVGARRDQTIRVS
jgi:adenylosuccinate synthase